ncbi:MAG: hypothetical protein JSS10_03940 [Verrucomicrobia bacterium]|nr:hypothetical protein [Verrucomicrobiota bacterium]
MAAPNGIPPSPSSLALLSALPVRLLNDDAISSGPMPPPSAIAVPPPLPALQGPLVPASSDPSNSPPAAPPPATPKVLSVLSVQPVLPATQGSPASSEHASPPPPAPPPPAQENAAANFWRQRPSLLEQQAQLTVVQKMKNYGSHLFWGTVALPWRLTAGARNLVSQKVKTAVTQALVEEGVSRLAPQEPNTPLKTLVDLLQELHAKVNAKIAISEELKSRASAILDDFLLNQKKYLGESPHPTTGFSTTLDRAEFSKFHALSEFLKGDDSLDHEGPFIKTLCNILEPRWQNQKQFYITKKAKQIIGPSTIAPSRLPNGHGRIEKPPERKHLFKVFHPQAALPQSSKNPLVDIQQEIDTLKSLGFKILLAFLILPETILSDEKNGALIGELIKKSEKTIDVKDSNQIFQELLCTELDNSDLNFIHKSWKKCCCLMLARPILFVLDHVFEKMKKDLFYFLGISTEERIELINMVLVTAAYEFINRLESEYKSLPGRNVKSSPETAIKKAIAELEIDKLTTPKLLSRWVDALMNRYAPAFNWAQTSKRHFDRCTQKAQPFHKIWYYSWAFLSAAIDGISVPFRWCFTKFISKTISAVASAKIHAYLVDPERKYGKQALNTVYKVLYNKLNSKNQGQPAGNPDSASPQRPTAMVDRIIQDNISKLVKSFLTILELQGLDISGLTGWSPNTLITKIEPIVIPKAKEQIAEGLQTFLQGESFPKFVFEALRDLNNQCLNFNLNKPKQGLVPLEQACANELQETVKTAIVETIEKETDLLKRVQTEADSFVDNLKSGILNFSEKFELNFINFKTLKTSFKMEAEGDLKPMLFLEPIDNLVEAHNMLFKSFQQGENSSHQMQIDSYKESFFAQSLPVSEHIQTLLSHASELKKAYESIGELRELLASLKKTKFPYAELSLTLQRIKNKNYPTPISDLIGSLEQAFKKLTSEELIKFNKAFLEGTVNTLKSQLGSSLTEQERAFVKLLEQIASEYVEIERQVRSLAGWAAKELTHFTCEVKPDQMSALKQLLPQLLTQYSSSLSGGISPLIMNQLDAFFVFIGKDHNILGLLWHMIYASLDISVPAKEFNKVVNSVETKLSVEE